MQDLNENERFIYHISPDEDEEYTRNTYMYMAEKEGIKKGQEVGTKKGQEIGMSKATLNIAENLLQKNYAIEEIMDITGLSEEKIKELQERRK